QLSTLQLSYLSSLLSLSSFFFHLTSPTETYTLSLHDALPIYCEMRTMSCGTTRPAPRFRCPTSLLPICRSGSPTARPDALSNVRDRKSTRLNSSHDQISYAVFCLKKKTASY